jgi:hypothetical protein
LDFLNTGVFDWDIQIILSKHTMFQKVIIMGYSNTLGVLAVPPLFLQGSGHSGGIPVDSGGMKFGRGAC